MPMSISGSSSDSNARKGDELLKNSQSRNKNGTNEDRKKLGRKPSLNIVNSVDLIDRLDQSGISGSPFHHDGPFDVISPERNSREDKNAPILAFPDEKDEPIQDVPRRIYSKREEKYDIDIIDDIFGANDVDEDDSDTTDSENYAVNEDDPVMKPGVIHGAYTDGLGTSTFIDGAGAPFDNPRKENEDESFGISNRNNYDYSDNEEDLQSESENLLSNHGTDFERYNKHDNFIDVDNSINKRNNMKQSIVENI